MQVLERLCWLVLWLERLEWPSSPSMRQSLWKCLLVWELRVSGTCLPRCGGLLSLALYLWIVLGEVETPELRCDCSEDQVTLSIQRVGFCVSSPSQA